MALTATEIRREVTDNIMAALRDGKVAWQKPWTGEADAPRNLQSSKRYRGINALLLSLRPFSDPRWTTFSAARKMGAQVRKGERSTLVTLWKRIRVKDENDPTQTKIIPILRYFRVFNVEQIEWPEGVLPALADPVTPEGFDPVEAGEDALTAYIDSDSELSLRWGGSRALYSPSEHYIQLPDRERFLTPEGFYATAFHECAHSTGKKLGREFGKSFGDAIYSREELTAEMAQAFVCAELGIDVQYENTGAYLKGWMKAIEDDDSLIIKAAGQAQKAADLILCRVYEPETPDTDNTTAPVAA